MKRTKTTPEGNHFSRQNDNEVIVEIGAELGSITLYGTRSDGEWLFTMEMIDQSLELIDGDWTRRNWPRIDTWEVALENLDHYQWFRLHPIRVHPAFREKVWSAVRERLQADDDMSEFTLVSWRDLCTGSLD